jgi:hypothetical protein
MHLRDFTLTNVRQNAKLNEIKAAIEKLKGYKVECQSLNLVDETDVNNEGYSQNIILQPLKESLLAQKDRKYKDKATNELSSQALTELALQEAKRNYLRLRDDFSLQQYDVLQEYPHTCEWRQTQMDQMKQVLSVSRGQGKQDLLGQSQAKNFYLILDLELPSIQVNF